MIVPDHLRIWNPILVRVHPARLGNDARSKDDADESEKKKKINMDPPFFGLTGEVWGYLFMDTHNITREQYDKQVSLNPRRLPDLAGRHGRRRAMCFDGE